MERQPPRYWGSWKGLVIKAIVVDGARTWSDIRDSTGLSEESLNKALSEMFDIGILEKMSDGTYKVSYDLYKDYRAFSNSSEIFSRQKRVFLTYSSADRQQAKMIYRKLLDSGVEVFLAETELAPTDSIVDSLQQKIAVSDYVIILLSRRAAQSSWWAEELKYAVDAEFKARDVALIPLLLDNYPISNYLRDYQPINLRYGFERGIRELLDRIQLIPEIDFTVLDGKAFENLIADLLKCLGFKGVVSSFEFGNKIFDFKAQYSYKDPFGLLVTETWLVEAKLYRYSRLDLNTLRAAVSFLSPIPGDYKLLLITNSHLTSATRNWVEKLQQREKAALRIIEGTELKTLLLREKQLVNKYFIRAGGGY